MAVLLPIVALRLALLRISNGCDGYEWKLSMGLLDDGIKFPCNISSKSLSFVEFSVVNLTPVSSLGIYVSLAVVSSYARIRKT